MQSLELAQSGQKEEANAELEQARKLSVEAHNLQTSLIQSELSGKANPPSLLAVHAQDHFMNSHLLLELAAVFLNQIEEIEDLKARNIAREDDDALVVFFDEETKLHPCIVQKKDGSFLYSTSDLATIKYRKDELNADMGLYVVDERQQEHFKQVFEIARMTGSPYDYEKVHIQFGIMRFANGVILSTRGGNVIRLIDLLNKAQEEVRKVIDEKNPDIPDAEKDIISDIVGTGAIKYFDLSQNRTSPILFDWDKVLSFEGNTGPYLQYTYVRIMSLLRKMEAENISIDNSKDIILDDMNDIERDLAVMLLRFPQVVVKAYEGFKPNLIADYLFDLAKTYNNFYNSKSILKEENKDIMQARILLSIKAADILKQGLSLLSIQTVDRM